MKNNTTSGNSYTPNNQFISEFAISLVDQYGSAQADAILNQLDYCFDGIIVTRPDYFGLVEVGYIDKRTGSLLSMTQQFTWN